MRHINKGDEPHEWLTDEEFKVRYPRLWEYENRPRPFAVMGDELKQVRIAKRITLREAAKATKLKIIDLSEMERGLIRPTHEVLAAYQILPQTEEDT